jgi:hypothetical protein
MHIKAISKHMHGGTGENNVQSKQSLGRSLGISRIGNRIANTSTAASGLPFACSCKYNLW